MKVSSCGRLGRRLHAVLPAISASWRTGSGRLAFASAVILRPVLSNVCLKKEQLPAPTAPAKLLDVRLTRFTTRTELARWAEREGWLYTGVAG